MLLSSSRNNRLVPVTTHFTANALIALVNALIALVDGGGGGGGGGGGDDLV